MGIRSRGKRIELHHESVYCNPRLNESITQNTTWIERDISGLLILALIPLNPLVPPSLLASFSILASFSLLARSSLRHGDTGDEVRSSRLIASNTLRVHCPSSTKPSLESNAGGDTPWSSYPFRAGPVVLSSFDVWNQGREGIGCRTE
jgi:hypothetical protein